MKSGLELRRCDPDNDMDIIVSLEREIFKPSEQYTLGFINWLCRNCTNYSYIAFMNGRPVGYIISCIEGLGRGHVISVGVLREYRRMGIGNALMCRSICSMAERGIDHVILEVRVSNTPAITLYRKLGFDVRDVLRSYYNDGEDAYLMILEDNKFEMLISKCCSVAKQPS
ncbi:ribosomal protein S18-alanine N-acetyltransferase [Vulcanisaeta sp. JCM 16161]|uniref:ribosomal protein S18-alanine N-acetyltransferase n=1 Tax=Vulcanisaeta sp. JCM 16161 TaxID=1295372 RepID=UPI0006D1BBB6|nr:ribosomal protein S18-alanine N-acetyltransferase [Vulcanisaeta sp. JCM 16161]